MFAIPFYDQVSILVFQDIPIYNFYADTRWKPKERINLISNPDLCTQEQQLLHKKGNADLLLNDDSLRFTGGNGLL
ncbi:hypothetical protein O9929_19475 [Vibrio lentus]|nr:hypothetical protein [Vibrio lentus]